MVVPIESLSIALKSVVMHDQILWIGPPDSVHAEGISSPFAGRVEVGGGWNIIS